MLFWVGDCIRKKPGERARALSACAAGCTAPDAPTTGWGGTRVMGYRVVVRTLVVARGMGPGSPVPLVLRQNPGKWPKSKIFVVSLWCRFWPLIGEFLTFLAKNPYPIPEGVAKSAKTVKNSDFQWKTVKTVIFCHFRKSLWDWIGVLVRNDTFDTTGPLLDPSIGQCCQNPYPIRLKSGENHGFCLKLHEVQWSKTAMSLSPIRGF